MKKYVIAFCLLMVGLSSSVNAADKDTLVVSSSLVCGMCEDFITETLKFEKGIVDLAFDLEANEIVVVYKSNKLTPEDIRLLISKAGYKADDVPADPKGYEALHKCCKAPHD